MNQVTITGTAYVRHRL